MISQIVYVQEKDIRKIAENETEDIKLLCQEDKVKEEVLKQINATGKRSNLKQMEV